MVRRYRRKYNTMVLHNKINREYSIMTIQDILAELQNIKEQSVNHDDISKDSMLEAITDLIHSIEGNDGLDGFNLGSDDDLYDTFDEIDFTQLQID